MVSPDFAVWCPPILIRGNGIVSPDFVPRFTGILMLESVFL